jgi:hypothetical protein
MIDMHHCLPGLLKAVNNKLVNIKSPTSEIGGFVGACLSLKCSFRTIHYKLKIFRAWSQLQ